MIYFFETSKDNLKEALDQVIGSTKYLHLRGKEQETSKIIEQMDNFFKRDYKMNYSVGGGIQNSHYVFISILLIVIIVLFYLFFKTKEYKGIKNKILFGETIDENTNHQGLYQKATAFEKDRNYKGAIRFYFIGILIHMNENSLCFLNDTKTNHEIIKELKEKRFSGVKAFKDVGDYFYYIWYGNKKVDKDMFLTYKEKINNLYMEVNKYNEE